ncbi:TPA: TIM barrel protein [Escherichia coli]|uniref:sugar phosphate isomerase/epimerase family protein n=1 Tax=Escherichia coli TaxID=562 RepID=UPI0017E16E3D|nr:TIM barrel protein [Escherichia coli O16]EFE7587098.1 TIM barrel protein [Escherichia coli]HAV9014052.1 TIM barrel protein [Escherichia coli]HBP8130208.1 TIM barrel protein [Escherichia coli]HCA4598674.1 TIM barrel protein [Escherichia coli]
MMTINNARKILQRVDTLPLYLHAYAFHLNMRLERVLPADLLDIASENNLRGVKIHVLDGERFSLGNMDDKELSAFGDKARRLNLDIHIETSASDKASIDEAVAIALKTGASSVRFYPRYEGNLRDVLSIIANDIAYVRETYQDCGLTFTIEQHEDLKSHELVSLVKESEMESLSLLFDFANMINANEHPIDALKTMAPHITQVHIKDALIVKEQGGLGHKACISGKGDMPFKALLTHLICLGDDEPQVTAYGLEEEVDYYAPAFRFEDEDDNPWIPYRQMSETPLPENHLLDARLRKEKEDAINQINHVRNVLQQIKQEANHLLNH